ncbi:MAG: tetratricopeptide repeat protein, partial [Gammaproteobacteria bacterium]|nr:tetratricopeptide repeat protein [Gammaproteobacteria bacterium]
MNREPIEFERHYDAGHAHRAAGRLDLARRSFVKALSIDPNSARAALGLGQTCYDLGNSDEALHYLDRAVRAEPGNAEALCYCGRALADAGHMDLALQFLQRAIETAPDEFEFKAAAIDVLQGIEFVAENAFYEGFLLDCFDDASVAHDALTNVATSLLWMKPVIKEALAADLLSSSQLSRLANEPLLMQLLSKTIGRSWAFEQFFIKLRSSLAGQRDPEHLPLLAAVAEQAFNTGYEQYQSTTEAELERELVQRGAASLTPAELMLLASFRALADVPGAADIVGWQDLPSPADRVIQRTLREPLRERQIAEQIESLTPI